MLSSLYALYHNNLTCSEGLTKLMKYLNSAQHIFISYYCCYYNISIVTVVIKTHNLVTTKITLLNSINISSSVNIIIIIISRLYITWPLLISLQTLILLINYFITLKPLHLFPLPGMLFPRALCNRLSHSSV